MQYELRTQVIEPPRKTFTHLVNRYGDRPASRYEEGSIDIQPKENFHYRPLWDPEHELYDETYSDFRLTDPYSFTDPRQYYYAPYVTSRAAMADASPPRWTTSARGTCSRGCRTAGRPSWPSSSCRCGTTSQGRR